MELAEILSRLRYSPKQGRFYSLRTGKILGSIARDGYRMVGVGGKQYAEHRLVWAAKTGSWPEGHLDHKDRNKAHNIFANLRAATRSQNMHNVSTPRTNTSGFKGVHRDKGKWRARIEVGGKKISLGNYPTQKDAYAAYCGAANSLLGEFARV